MRRFFADINNNQVIFSKDTLSHIKVIRLNKGENIEVCYLGDVYICQVTNINPFDVKIIEKISDKNNRELAANLVLFCPLLKRDNFELVLQKAVELGVKHIVPYISSRVIKRVTKQEFEQKRERFEKIILNASEQSNRSYIPKLDNLYNLEELVELYKDSSNKFIAYEDASIKGDLINLDSKIDDIVIVIGPEGGFAPKEVDMFINNNYKVVSLGKRILRAETACIYSLSVISYLIENNK
jgi:16S rRNA (uracil1498-N3)-methyltransferase